MWKNMRVGRLHLKFKKGWSFRSLINQYYLSQIERKRAAKERRKENKKEAERERERWGKGKETSSSAKTKREMKTRAPRT